MMETDELLIDTIREYPCLYNSKLHDFKVQLVKENAWAAIATLLDRPSDRCYSVIIPCAWLALSSFVNAVED